MAFGILKIVMIVLIILAVLLQILLYMYKNDSKNIIFVVNMLLGVFLAYLAFTSLPTNYTGQRVLAIAWGIIAILGIILKLADRKLVMASKMMLSIAIIGSLVQLLLL